MIHKIIYIIHKMSNCINFLNILFNSTNILLINKHARKICHHLLFYSAVMANLSHVCHRWHTVPFLMTCQASGSSGNCIRRPCSPQSLRCPKITWAFLCNFLRLQRPHKNRALLLDFQRAWRGRPRGEVSLERRSGEATFVCGMVCMVCV